MELLISTPVKPSEVMMGKLVSGARVTMHFLPRHCGAVV